jgi:hypothetical protein
LRQKKLGTIIKQLVKLGLINVLHDEKNRLLIQQAVGNNRLNERSGVPEDELGKLKM